jgi:hypothetical protein
MPFPHLLERGKGLGDWICFLECFFGSRGQKLMHESLSRPAWELGQDRVEVTGTVVIVVRWRA